LAFISEKATHGSWQRTGGSTGRPLDVYWGYDAHLEMLRAKYRFYHMWGIDIFDRMVFLWGHGASFSPGWAGILARIRQPAEDRLRNRLRLSAYQLGREDLHRYLRRIAAFCPASLYGYSNAVYLLALEAMVMGFHCDSLKLVILTSEPVSPKIRATVQRAFGVPASLEYGSIECDFIAGESADGTLRVREDVVFLETIGRTDGSYYIVLTVLTNPSFPLIRYSIGDMTRVPLESPSAGFAILKSVDGRDNDLLMSRTGRILHPTIIEEIFDHTPGVRRYRVTQKADGSLAVLVESMDKQPIFNTSILLQKLSGLFEGYPVEVEVVSEVPSLLSGKHRWILSEQKSNLHTD
jgi:phenylacetate-CoA ligase